MRSLGGVCGEIEVRAGARAARAAAEQSLQKSNQSLDRAGPGGP
jgi:hypothetical protein